MKTRLLGWASVVVAAGTAGLGACEAPDSESQGEDTGVASDALTCVTFQRGTNGTVADATVESAYGTWNQGTSTTLWTGHTGGVLARSLVRFDLSSIPSGSTVTSATASIYVSAAQTTTINVHRITSSWSESTVAWNNFSAGYDTTVAATFQTGGYLTRSFDITSMAQGWVSGANVNNGFLLEEDPVTTKTGYASSESTPVSRRPALTVCYNPPNGGGSGGAGSSSASSTHAATSTVAASTASVTSAASTTAASTTAASTSVSTSAAATTSSTTAASTTAASTSAASTSAASTSASSSSSTGSGGGNPSTVRIAVIGDYGAQGGGLVSVASMVNGWHPDQIVTVGDNVYSSVADPYDGLVGQYYHQFIWPYSGAYGQGSATGTNHFWPIPGNHDYDHGNLGPYLNFFTLPNNEYYYTQYLDSAQKVRLFALSADDRTPAGNSASSTQGIWLQANMSTDVNSCFKIVAEHEPPYCSTIGQSEGNDPTMQWPYHAWGADLVMSGSRHGYERLAVDGIPYIVNGLGGGSLWGDWNIIEPHSVYRFPTTPQRYGAALLTITVGNGIGTLTGQFFGVSDGGAPDTVASDTFTITKACN